MSSNIVQIKGLNFGYEKEVLNLKDINMDIEEGKITTILGGNGAGKSTLFLNLNGILKPTSGQIIIDGETLDYSKKKLMQMRKNVGIVFQDPDDQLFSADVYRDISFGAVNLGLPKEEVAKRVEVAMRRTRVDDLAERPTHALSYGQKKRVAIAGVLVMEPKVIILDEPTAGLDPQGVREIMELLKELNQDKGLSIIMATHDMDIVSEFCDYAYIMNNGEITARGTPREIFSDIKTIKENNLRMPILSELMHKLLHEDGLDVDGKALTMDEVRDQISNMQIIQG